MIVMLLFQVTMMFAVTPNGRKRVMFVDEIELPTNRFIGQSGVLSDSACERLEFKCPWSSVHEVGTPCAECNFGKPETKSSTPPERKPKRGRPIKETHASLSNQCSEAAKWEGCRAHCSGTTRCLLQNQKCQARYSPPSPLPPLNGEDLDPFCNHAIPSNKCAQKIPSLLDLEIRPTPIGNIEI